MKLLRDAQANPMALKHATELERKVFRYAFDKTITFGVNFSSTSIESELGEPSEEMFVLLDLLASRAVTGHDAIRRVREFAAAHGGLIKLICNKHLQAGMRETTINKYIPNCVPVFSVQLAKDEPLSSVKFPCFGQLKYDGVRVIVMKTLAGPLRFYTRNGLELRLPYTADLLKDIPKGVTIDTEVTIRQGTTEDRAKVSGMLNSARQGGVINESLLVFNAFDMLPTEGFLGRKCLQPYQERLDALANLVKHDLTSTQADVVTFAETRVLHSAAEANTWFENVLNQGQEGLILKPHDHLYKFRRSKDWIKLKAVKTADLACIGIEEGRNKYTGMIGALVCKGIVEGKMVTVSVGSGLTDYDRDLPEDIYLGKTIEVKYNTVITAADGTHSLFLPRFTGVRYDK